MHELPQLVLGSLWLRPYVFGFLGVLAAYRLERFTRQLFLRERQLEQERTRSDGPLLNMLPAAIVERLKTSSGARIAQSFDRVSVLLGNGVPDSSSSTVTVRASLSSLKQSVIDILSASAARLELDNLAGQLATLSQVGGVIGAFQSRIGVALNNLSTMIENIRAAESTITDADIAQDSSRLVRKDILQQAATAVLVQANQAPRLALQLLS